LYSEIGFIRQLLQKYGFELDYLEYISSVLYAFLAPDIMSVFLIGKMLKSKTFKKVMQLDFSHRRKSTLWQAETLKQSRITV